MIKRRKKSERKGFLSNWKTKIVIKVTKHVIKRKIKKILKKSKKMQEQAQVQIKNRKPGQPFLTASRTRSVARSLLGYSVEMVASPILLVTDVLTLKWLRKVLFKCRQGCVSCFSCIAKSSGCGGGMPSFDLDFQKANREAKPFTPKFREAESKLMSELITAKSEKARKSVLSGDFFNVVKKTKFEETQKIAFHMEKKRLENIVSKTPFDIIRYDYVSRVAEFNPLQNESKKKYKIDIDIGEGDLFSSLKCGTTARRIAMSAAPLSLVGTVANEYTCWAWRTYLIVFGLG